YGNKIDISWKLSGEVRDIFIAPLMMLPFIENAFKHGTSEQIERCWLSIDMLVKEGWLSAKIANSKNEYSANRANNGIGIANVRKRLELIYRDQHELKINDEGSFFVVALSINLVGGIAAHPHPGREVISKSTIHEPALPAY